MADRRLPKSSTQESRLSMGGSLQRGDSILKSSATGEATEQITSFTAIAN